jgi:serine protease AprX
VNKQGLRQDERGSALWGNGTRGGGSRGSALWGKGGRRAGATLISAALAAVVLSFGASLPANASGGTGKVSSGTFAPAALLSQAQGHADDSFAVIVQGDGSTDADTLAHRIGAWAAHADKKLADAADKAAQDLAAAQKELAKKQAEAAAKAAKAALTGKKSDITAAAKAADDAAKAQAKVDAANAAVAAAGDSYTQAGEQITREQVKNEFSSIDGVAVTLTGRQITNLYDHASGLLSITPDAPAHVSGSVRWTSNQLWPYETGNSNNWEGDQNATVAANMPTIAIVDSGVQSRDDFGSRLLASVNLSTLPNNSAGDGRGHGTFVAGVAAGASPNYAGASPSANLLSIDVLDDTGMGLTSDIINACQWILDHKAQYNIKVANFSLHSSITAPFWIDPLDRAVEKLWFNGITVVVAAGNYGSASGPSGVLYSPGDDPFVITVGAADIGSKANTKDDTVAPWSAWGTTIDGFAKPEITAPGRYMVGPVPATSSLVTERPTAVVAPGYIQLSGTSFATPIVSGVAAEILARHPNFTPDQVKGALMLTSRPVDGALGGAAGVGEITANKAAQVESPPNPDAGLDQFVKADSTTGSLAFDAASWNSTALANASWNSVSWNSASWNSASWNSASWNSVSWNSASWNSASWNSASWNSASWNSASWNSSSQEDAAEGDATADSSVYTLSVADIADLLTDPDVAPSNPSWLTLPPTTSLATTP